MQKTAEVTLDSIAKDNGYSSWFDLLRDYRFIPTVLMPKHRRIEILKLFLQYVKKKGNVT